MVFNRDNSDSEGPFLKYGTAFSQFFLFGSGAGVRKRQILLFQMTASKAVTTKVK